MGIIVRQILFIAILAVAAVLFYACEQKQQAGSADLSQLEYSPVDSFVFEGIGTRDPESVYQLIDSLEQSGDLSALGADVFRAIAYNRFFRRTDYDANAEELNRRAFSHKVPQDQQRWYYNYAGNELAYYLYMRHNYDGFLRVAVPLLASMDSLGNGTMEEKVNLYSLMGCCYVKLEQPDKARSRKPEENVVQNGKQLRGEYAVKLGNKGTVVCIGTNIPD